MCEQNTSNVRQSVGSLRLLRHPQVGIQGDLWIIGAQNAGKSSVINAMKYHAGTRNATAALTTAPLPGTTLDMVMVEGLPLMARSRCYDTPGVPHPYQLTSMFGGMYDNLPHSPAIGDYFTVGGPPMIVLKPKYTSSAQQSFPTATVFSGPVFPSRR